MQVRLHGPLKARLDASMYEGDGAVSDAKRNAVRLPLHLSVQRHGCEADNGENHFNALATGRSAGSGQGEDF